MKKLIFIAFVLGAAYLALNQSGALREVDNANAVATAGSTDQILAAAFKNHQSDFQVQGEGAVTRVLSDDTAGSRHQRFIVELGSGQTLLISHNIDLAPRVAGIEIGDRIRFYGEYEWNSQGGVIHWTHHDPSGNHIAGWIKHRGQTYQ